MPAIQPIDTSNRTEVDAFLRDHWHTTTMAVRGMLFDLSRTDGALVREEGEIVGLITWRAFGDALEILSLDSVRENLGVGTALLGAAEARARTGGLDRLLCITTNDNLRALGFYQKRGFILKALYPNAVAAARRLKPEIPLTSAEGIPIRDELELEKKLEAAPLP